MCISVHFKSYSWTQITVNWWEIAHAWMESPFVILMRSIKDEISIIGFYCVVPHFPIWFFLTGACLAAGDFRLLNIERVSKLIFISEQHIWVLSGASLAEFVVDKYRHLLKRRISPSSCVKNMLFYCSYRCRAVGLEEVLPPGRVFFTSTLILTARCWSVNQVSPKANWLRHENLNYSTRLQTNKNKTETWVI